MPNEFETKMIKILKIITISVIAIFFIGCSDNKAPSDLERYGNTFSHINNKRFEVPDNWNTHELFDGAFQIQLPNYMKQTESHPMGNSSANCIFMYRDTTDINNYHYGRVGIDYYRHSGGIYAKANEYVNYSDQEIIFAPVLKNALSGGRKVLEYTVPDAELLNGPIYDSHSLFGEKLFYAYDAFYRRKGHTKGEGPVSCHIFLMMNKTEAALVTIAFHDKDSILFENLFNAVKTFQWYKIRE